MFRLSGYRLDSARKFSVIITETLERVVVVEASGQKDAEQIVSDGWHNSEYILGPENFTGVDFKAIPIGNDAE